MRKPLGGEGGLTQNFNTCMHELAKEQNLFNPNCQLKQIYINLFFKYIISMINYNGLFGLRERKMT